MLGLFYRASDAVRHRLWGSGHGRLGEDLAHRFLRGRGCTIVARNYRPRSGAGEIDLVAWHGETLVFVEVKTRETADYGSPEAAVDMEKRSRLERAASDYARRAGVERQRTRFDVVSVVLCRPPRISWRRDAFAPRGW